MSHVTAYSEEEQEERPERVIDGNGQSIRSWPWQKLHLHWGYTGNYKYQDSEKDTQRTKVITEEHIKQGGSIGTQRKNYYTETYTVMWIFGTHRGNKLKGHTEKRGYKGHTK